MILKVCLLIVVLTASAYGPVDDTAISSEKKPTSAKQAKADWKKFRKEGDKYFLREVTWKVKVSQVHKAGVMAYLEGDWDYGMFLFVYSDDLYGKFTGLGTLDQKYWSEAVNKGLLPRIVKDDWAIFTGKFKEVTDGGKLKFAVTEVKNLGP